MVLYLGYMIEYDILKLIYKGYNQLVMYLSLFTIKSRLRAD